MSIPACSAASSMYSSSGQIKFLIPAGIFNSILNDAIALNQNVIVFSEILCAVYSFLPSVILATLLIDLFNASNLALNFLR